MCEIVQYKGMAIIGPIYRSVISSGLPSQHKDHMVEILAIRSPFSL